MEATSCSDLPISWIQLVASAGGDPGGELPGRAGATPAGQIRALARDRSCRQNRPGNR